MTAQKWPLGFISDQASYTTKGKTNISHTVLQIEYHQLQSSNWKYEASAENIFFFKIMQSYEIKLFEKNKKTKQKPNNDKGR